MYNWTKALKYREEVFGMAILWIMFFHMNFYVHFDAIPDVVRKLQGKGWYGVDIFLFLSAVGCYMSMTKHTVAEFYRNRVKRVVVPFLLAGAVFFGYIDFFNLHMGPGRFILDMTTVNFWIVGSWDFPLWYIPFIFILYIIYPWVYKLAKKTNHISTLVLLLVTMGLGYFATKFPTFYAKYELPIARTPAFFVGMLAAPLIFDEKKNKIPLAAAIACLAILVIDWCFKFKMSMICRRWVAVYIAMCIIVVYGQLREYGAFPLISKLFKFAGTVSLEMYLLHCLIDRTFELEKVWSMAPGWVMILIVFTSTFALAYLLRFVSQKINAKLFPKK